MGILNLPTEILVHNVFPAVADWHDIAFTLPLVCRKWNQICRDESLWEQLFLREIHSLIEKAKETDPDRLDTGTTTDSSSSSANNGEQTEARTLNNKRPLSHKQRDLKRHFDATRRSLGFESWRDYFLFKQTSRVMILCGYYYCPYDILVRSMLLENGFPHADALELGSTTSSISNYISRALSQKICETYRCILVFSIYDWDFEYLHDALGNLLADFVENCGGSVVVMPCANCDDGGSSPVTGRFAKMHPIQLNNKGYISQRMDYGGFFFDNNNNNNKIPDQEQQQHPILTNVSHFELLGINGLGYWEFVPHYATGDVHPKARVIARYHNDVPLAVELDVKDLQPAATTTTAENKGKRLLQHQHQHHQQQTEESETEVHDGDGDGDGPVVLALNFFPAPIDYGWDESTSDGAALVSNAVEYCCMRTLRTQQRRRRCA